METDVRKIRTFSKAVENPAHQRDLWNSKVQEAFKDLLGDEQKVLASFFQGFDERDIAKGIKMSPEDIRKSAFDGLDRLRISIERWN